MTVHGWAEGLVTALAIYAGLGVAFAIAFVVRGLERVDPAARASSWGFRLIVLPASAALWPLLLARWRRAAGGAPTPPVESNVHRRAAARGEGA